MKITRRAFASLAVFAAPLLLLSSPANSQTATSSQKQEKSVRAYIGTYTTKQTSKGIYAYRFDVLTGRLTAEGLAGESVDPSFVTVHPTGKFLYAVNEVSDFNGMKSGAVSAFAIDAKTGKLKFLNQVSTHGAGPCFVSLDKTGKWVLVANYDGGSVATFPVQADGSLGLVAGFVQHSGSSVNKERQEGPHAHWIGVSPDNRLVLVCDLGLDDVLVYRLDPDTGILTPNEPPFAKVAAGSGPRHLAFHPNGKFVYVLSEMAATVTVFSYQARNGALTHVQTIDTLPESYAGLKEAAEIVVDPAGKFLYASNRAGQDSITIFAIDPAKGTLRFVDRVSTKGKTPRNFAIDPSGAFLLAANQESGNIVVFRIDPLSGKLFPNGMTAEVGAPVCIAFAPAP